MAARLLHHIPTPHWASLKHALPHAPVMMLQNGPACPAPQFASLAHTLHAPAV
jgi:hypothetical protein